MTVPVRVPKGWELTDEVRVPNANDRWLGVDYEGRITVMPEGETVGPKGEVIILRKVTPDTLTITIPYKLGLKLQRGENWLALNATSSQWRVADELERAVREAQDLL